MVASWGGKDLEVRVSSSHDGTSHAEARFPGGGITPPPEPLHQPILASVFRDLIIHHCSLDALQKAIWIQLHPWTSPN